MVSGLRALESLVIQRRGRQEAEDRDHAYHIHAWSDRRMVPKQPGVSTLVEQLDTAVGRRVAGETGSMTE